jgi:hypothetical protein
VTTTLLKHNKKGAIATLFEIHPFFFIALLPSAILFIRDTGSSMEPHQRFLFKGKELAIQVRKDSGRGYYYSRLNDIQSIFQGASQFKVNGTAVLFLKNEQQDL